MAISRLLFLRVAAGVTITPALGARSAPPRPTWAFEPMPDADRRKLIDTIAGDRKVTLARFFQNYADS